MKIPSPSDGIHAAFTMGSIVLALILLTPAPGQSQVPLVHPYSGVLEFDGEFLSGPVAMRFTLYQASSAVWTEEWSEEGNRSCLSPALDCRVMVYAGEFTALLGRYTSLSSVLDTAGLLTLGVEVRRDICPAGATTCGTDPTTECQCTWFQLAGRVPIEPAPYALWSTQASDMHVGGNLQVDGDATAQCPGGTCPSITVSGETQSQSVEIGGVLRTGVGQADALGTGVTASLSAAGSISTTGLGPATDTECNFSGGDLDCASNGELRFGTHDQPVMTSTAAGTTLEIGALPACFTGNCGGGCCAQEISAIGPTVFAGTTTVTNGLDAGAGPLTWARGSCTGDGDCSNGKRCDTTLGVCLAGAIDTSRPVAQFVQIPASAATTQLFEFVPYGGGPGPALSANDWFCFIGSIDYAATNFNLNNVSQQLFGAYTYVNSTTNEWWANLGVVGATGLNATAVCIQAGLASSSVSTWFPEGALPEVPNATGCRFPSNRTDGTTCNDCLQSSCCMELRDCEADTGCSCYLRCLEGGGSHATCFNLACFPGSQDTQARINYASCNNNSCGGNGCTSL